MGNFIGIVIDKNGKSANRKYYFSSDHESFIEAKKLIDSEKTWTAITPKNNTHYYRCNKVVSRSSKWCSAAVYIYKHQDSNKASIFIELCVSIYIFKIILLIEYWHICRCS